MTDSLTSSIKIASSAIAAQSMRMRVVTENLANANSTGRSAGSDPYARKTISFESMMDDVAGSPGVRISEINVDSSPFRIEHSPSHPAADAKGDVKMPNVNVMVELADMREATRSYESNVQVVRQARELISMSIDLMRST